MQKGFTLIELLVVLVIGMGLVSMIFVVFPNMKNKKALEASSKLVVSMLEEARSNTLSSKNGLSYSVQLNTITLNSTDIRNIVLNGGGSTVTFERLTGETSNYGTFEVYLLSNTNSYKTITIARSGEINEN